MELRQLRYFLAVAEEQHISRAAERLSMQQPPLSQQIKALESELGVKLFTRKARGVESTGAGLSFQADIERILKDLDEAVARARRIDRGEAGQIVIGVTSSTLSHEVTKKAISAFRKNRPGISIQIRSDGSAELMQGLRDNELDVAFLRASTGDHDGVRLQRLVEEPLYAVLPEDFPLQAAADGPISLRTLAACPLILYRRSAEPALYKDIVSALASTGVELDIVQEAPNAAAAVDLVSTGLGVSIIPRSHCHAGTPQVAFRPLEPHPLLVATINFATRRAETSPIVRAFSAFVRSEETARDAEA